ncbi:MAG: hypothetical protein QXW82_07645 [Candidatus Bathyarchaeia archaeon]
MKRKIAVITIELVEESFGSTNEEIKQEFIEWFRENAFQMPWVKEVRSVEIREEPL